MKTVALPREEAIASHIHFIRGEKVILDADLASLYGVETKRLKEAVRRNKKRFPSDFMFELTRHEYASLRSQFVTLKEEPLRTQFATLKNEAENLRTQFATSSWGGARYKPFAFTEQGVAMLSGVLNSSRAIEVNIAIMRTFVQIRSWMTEHKELAKKIADLEKKYDGNFAKIFDVLKLLVHPPATAKRTIGFQLPEKKS